MEVEEYLNKMRLVQKALLELFEAGSRQVAKYNELINLLTKTKISKKKDEFKSFLFLLMNIYYHHYHQPNIFNQIKKLIIFLQNDIQQMLPNSEIYTIFDCQEIRLYLYQKKILKFDQQIIDHLKYSDYFSPELKPLVKEEEFVHKFFYIPNDYETQRAKGGSGARLGQIIANDSLEQFISYSKNKDSDFLSKNLKSSQFETNIFLISNRYFSLIEYAAINGSAKIFKYLIENKVKIDDSIWLYAIHGKNPEIIHILEKNQIKPNSYEELYLESIKCHHNDLAKYIKNKYLADKNDIDISAESIQYYNFEFIRKEMIDSSRLPLLIKYDHTILTRILLQDDKIDVNIKTKILNDNFLDGVLNFKQNLIFFNLTMIFKIDFFINAI